MLLSQMAAEAAKDYKYDIILANVNGKLTEISDMDITDEKVEFITVGETMGNEAYKRSVLLLMLNAIHKLDTDNKIKRVTVEFSLSKGLYCDIKGDFEITEEFLNKVKEVMRADVKKNLPIKKQGMKTSEAIKLFKKFGMEDKTQLFKYRISSYVNVYSIEGYYDYFYGYMAANTGILKTFDIFQYDKGFVLQLPTKVNPETVPEFAPQAKLFNVLMERSEWADMLGVDTVASLNKHIISGDINSLILVQEALQEQKIVEIVNQIKEREGVKFIMRPPWAISQSLTSTAGLSAVKHWHMASRTLPGVVLAFLWGGMPAGITMALSGRTNSSAARRLFMWPLWGGSNVPPYNKTFCTVPIILQKRRRRRFLSSFS